MSRKIRLLAIVCMALACKKESKDYQSHFTLLNASPDAINYRLAVGPQEIVSMLPYGIPQENIQVNATTDSIRWGLLGQAGRDSSFVADLPNGSRFTLLFFDSATRYKSMLISEPKPTEANARQAYLRIFPLIHDADSLVLQCYVNDTTRRTLSAVRRFADFYTAGSSGSYNPVDTFNSKIWLYNKSQVIDSINRQQLLPGKKYTVFLTGVLGNTGTRRPTITIREVAE